MRTFIIVIVAALVACSSAFSTNPVTRTAFKTVSPLAMSKNTEPSPLVESAPVQDKNNNAAAIAAFATAMAPIAAQAADIDEGVIIGYGAGLVACVVSLAVGFSIGYGTLAKL
mmetsp:Transcript_38999/g.45447  ORF Transcript_38999/g.45447 Transcript_38999/m.45447 type:complete len:113 (-) Transcript_38999:287-625(-)|eukprot:CAMPEP_0171292706 /NCGR_PEP_ID=MMETSP0816-20121228/407_1 /TAXON_ID=420281 /ORGANISM="Proboscia inermis, Strain CCAP1064/1" /LENGTH=112 /DNA_ID=CAMNT_0011762631 /DNA_START=53 /DNA_END=391 /DNA_ORIENTATION=-